MNKGAVGGGEERERERERERVGERERVRQRAERWRERNRKRVKVIRRLVSIMFFPSVPLVPVRLPAFGCIKAA